MSLRIGVQIQPQHADFEQMREAWQAAEELGVDSIYTWDHFYPLYGDAEGKHFEGATSLTALAASTERARIGALVFCNSLSQPAAVGQRPFDDRPSQWWARDPRDRRRLV